MSPEKNIFLKAGERGVIVGQSGSGKTAGAVWQLANSPLAPVIVLDTKGEEKFDALPRARPGDEPEELIEVTSLAEFKALKHSELPEYTVVRPGVRELADVELLDSYLMTIYERLAPAFVYVDEAYQFHESGRAGPGLIGLLTRGRSRGITTLLGSQKPAWVSRFAFSEAKRLYVYALTDAADRKRLAELIPGFDELEPLDPESHHFYFYRVGRSAPELFAPVPLLEAIEKPKAPGRTWL